MLGAARPGTEPRLAFPGPAVFGQNTRLMRVRPRFACIPSGKVRHDIRDEKFTGLYVVPLIAIDQQLDAGVLVLPDQVDGLGHRTGKAAQRSVGSQPLALRRHRCVVAGK